VGSGLIRAMVTYLSNVYRTNCLHTRPQDNLEPNTAISLFTYRQYFSTKFEIYAYMLPKFIRWFQH